MGFMRALVTIPRLTGDLADSMTNTWHFEQDVGNTPEDIETLLRAFYQSQEVRLSNQYYNAPFLLKVYDLEDTVPRVPIFEGDIPMSLTTAIPTLPPEVSMVLSFHGTFESGIRNSRRRGRIYLPTMIGTPTIIGGQYRWNQSAVNSVVAAADALRANAISGLNWAVFSPTTVDQGGSLSAAFDDVIGGWVDLDPDIQRRRGPGSGAPRTTFP